MANILGIYEKMTILDSGQKTHTFGLEHQTHEHKFLRGHLRFLMYIYLFAIT